MMNLDELYQDVKANLCNHPNRDYCQDCRNCPASKELETHNK